MIEIQYATGNFALKIVGEPLAAKVDALIEAGVRYETEREVASACYKSLCGGKTPKGFKRESLAFTPERAESFRKVAEKSLGEILDGVVIEVTQNVGGLLEEARDLMSAHESHGDLESWLSAKAHFVGETHGDDGEFSHDALMAIAIALRAKRQAARDL